MFLDPGSFVEPTMTMGHFREWASSIASAYLNSGVDPTMSLCKLARVEELTPPQIATVAGEANKLIHQHKYASAKDKYMAADFPHADARTALGQLQGGSVKVAAQIPEPVLRQNQSWDEYAVWGVERPTQVKTAELKHEFKAATLRAEMVRDHLNDRQIMSKLAADNAEQAFIKTARQYVIQDSNSATRMKTLGGLDHFAKCANMDAKPQLAKLAYVLGREGLLTPAHAKTAMAFFMSKVADCKAPQELISEWLPARVVNGNHPLFITLKTFHENRARMNGDRGASSIVDDKLHILRQRVRAL